MEKPDIHSEWFATLEDKECPCGLTGQVYDWGEYNSGEWMSIEHFCEGCFLKRVVPQLSVHAAECGCSFELLPKEGHCALPGWLKQPEPDGAILGAKALVALEATIGATMDEERARDIWRTYSLDQKKGVFAAYAIMCP